MRKCLMLLIVTLTLILPGCQIYAQQAGKKIEVIVFLGADCPISQDYIGVLNKLQKQYPEVQFKGRLPSSSNRKKKLFKKEYQVEFPLYVDKSSRRVKKFGITVTPEVALLDSSGIVRYKGAIDNWYYELGRHRTQATEHYLNNAIEDVLAGREVQLALTNPVGCILPRPK